MPTASQKRVSSTGLLSISQKWFITSSTTNGALALLLYGMYMAGYEYTFYKEYKTIEQLSIFRDTPWKQSCFKITLPVKFTPKKHEEVAKQIVLVRSETRKGFLIIRYKDDVIQLLAMPTRYLDLQYYKEACYNITDPTAEEKLRKLLDIYCKDDD